MNELAAANHLGLSRTHLLQGFERLLGFSFLNNTQNGVDDNNDKDDDDVGNVGLALHSA